MLRALLWLPALSHAAGWGVDLPRNASQVLLNLGCNLAPVLPDDANDDAVVLCFEPIPSVVRRIPAHPRLLTIPAAVSSFDGVATMHTYAKNAQSSSLGARAKEMDWNDDPARGDGDQFVVPVLSLRSVYASLAGVHVCVEIKSSRRVQAESSRRPSHHRRDACSMAWRCRFLTARPSQDGRIIAKK